MVPSPPPAAIRVPSGLNATQENRMCPLNVFFSFPDSRSHSRIGPSKLAEASVRPSGLNAKDRNPRTDAWNVVRSVPVATSQVFRNPGAPAEAKDFPSGLNARQKTLPVCRVRVRTGGLEPRMFDPDRRQSL